MTESITKSEPKLKDVLKDLDAAVMRTLQFFDKLDTTDLPALLRAFKDLDENWSLLDAIKKILDQQYDKLSYEIIPDAMDAQEVDSIALAGRIFFLNGKLYASIVKDNEAQAYAWLEEHNLGSLIKPNVNSQTLSAAVKEYLELNGKFPPEELIKTHKKRYTAIRKK